MAKKSYHFVPGWMDYETAAAYTCFSVRTVKSWYRQGLIPAARVDDGHPRFKREDIDALLEKHKKPSLLAIAEEIINKV